VDVLQFGKIAMMSWVMKFLLPAPDARASGAEPSCTARPVQFALVRQLSA